MYVNYPEQYRVCKSHMTVSYCIIISLHVLNEIFLVVNSKTPFFECIVAWLVISIVTSNKSPKLWLSFFTYTMGI